MNPTAATVPGLTTKVGGWRAAIFIIFVEIAERFAFYGISGNLMTYLTTRLSYRTADAAKNVNTWQGVAMICPLLGAFVADSILGRFKTVIVSSVIYLFSLVLLMFSTSLASDKHHRPFFFLGLYILAIGEGGHKPSVQTFAADQFSDETEERRAALSSFFNYWYVGIILGASAGIGTMIFVQQSAGWGVGFGVPAGSMALAFVVFVAGIKFYKRDIGLVTSRSPYTRVAQVLVAAVRKRRVMEEEWGVIQVEDNMIVQDSSQSTQRGKNLARTKQFRCLDKAMVIDHIDARSQIRNPWRLCSLNQVEEVKLLLRLIPIWLTLFPITIVFAQFFTFFLKQANSLSSPLATRLHLRPFYLPYFTSNLVLILILILYDPVLTPFFRLITGRSTGLTVLQRIGVGQFLCLVIMSMAAIVETRRVTVATAYGLLDQPQVVVPMSVWWVMPHFTVLVVAEAFVAVGMQQLFYEQMPKGLRSLGAAAYISTTGLGSFVSSGIISIVQAATSRHQDSWLVNNINRAHLDGFFLLLAGICGLGFLMFLVFSRRFVYKKEVSEEDEGGNMFCE